MRRKYYEGNAVVDASHSSANKTHVRSGWLVIKKRERDGKFECIPLIYDMMCDAYLTDKCILHRR